MVSSTCTSNSTLVLLSQVFADGAFVVFQFEARLNLAGINISRRGKILVALWNYLFSVATRGEKVEK